MDSKKAYPYGYQPLDEYTSQDTDETGVQKKLGESIELDQVSNTGEKVDSDLENDENNNEGMQVNGLSVVTAGLFIVGEICGAGVVAFPAALSKSGMIGGMILIVVVLVMCVYCGLLLGYSWKRVKELRQDKEPLRDPYPYIGEIAVGKGVRHAITFCLNFQIFLTCVVYVILAAEIVGSFISFHVGDIHSSANLRIWLVIITCIVLPFTWLGTPKDFWFVALAAAGSTTVAVVLIIIKYAQIAPPDLNTVTKQSVTFGTFASAFGTFVFGFTGSSLFPTIQSDMKDPSPKSFAKAAYLGYIGITLLYVPTAIGGYLTLGKDLESSILKTLSHYDNQHGTDRVIVSIAEFLFAAHFLSGFILMVNPLLQQFEAFVGVPYKFSPKRVGVRTLVVLSILATCELFPQFGPIVDLVGGSVNVFLCFIFPIWCYIGLYPDTPMSEKLLMLFIVIFASVAAIASTVSNCLNIKEAFHDLYLAANATGHPKS